MSSLEKFKQLWQNMARSEESKFETEILKFLDFFCELLEIELTYKEPGDDFYHAYLDMSNIQMKVSNTTPFFITRIRTNDKHQINNLFLKVKNNIYKDKLQDQVSFIIVIGQTDYFSTLGKDSLLDLAILDESNLKQIVSAQKPRSELIKICKNQINVQRLSPYETVEPVVGRMFYGRKWEMQQLINRADTNFVITGCRKIGKSSLILNAFHRMREEATLFPVFLDCYPFKTSKDFVEQVVIRLDEIRELRRMTVIKFHDFLRRMKKKFKKRITFIMDEVDGLLENDKNHGWELFHILSSAHAEGYCRFIITGYRTVFEESVNLDSPIYKFLEPIQVHDLDHNSAVNLITQPIRDMGIHLADAGKIIDRILKQTYSQPNLIQFICKKLVERVGKRNANEITYDDLIEVEKSSEYRHYISDTFIYNSNTKEQLIVFCMLNYEEFTIKDIDKETAKKGISMALYDLERVCAILEMANVFRRIEGKYKFSNLALPKILKENYDIHYFLKKLVSEVV